MFDVIIRGGRIVDGTGGPSFTGDVGSSDGVIVEIAQSIDSPARRTLDASGLLVCPGFIDVHAHDDLAVLHDALLLNKLMQGVTTTIVGNCGLAPAPVAQDAALQTSIEEMIGIVRDVGVPVHISHLKAVGLRNWGSVRKAIALIQQARREGLQVTCDAYPYSAGSTTILSLMPPWSLQGGIEAALGRLEDSAIHQRIKTDLKQLGADWDNVALLTGFDRIVLTSTTAPEIARYAGFTFAEIAEQLGCDHVDAYLHIVREGGGNGTIVIHHMDDHDVRQVLQFEQTVIGSDGLPSADGHPHPRLYGTFPRYLGQYVRDEHLIPLEEAVRRITFESARRFRLGNRGLIQRGYVADVNVIDLERLADRATYASPRQFSDGMVHILVSGTVVVEHGQSTGMLPGTFIIRSPQ